MIVVKAEAAGLVHESTLESDKKKIIVAMTILRPGLDCKWRRNHPAYKVAPENLYKFKKTNKRNG